jgi:hypothetical protein
MPLVSDACLYSMVNDGNSTYVCFGQPFFRLIVILVEISSGVIEKVIVEFEFLLESKASNFREFAPFNSIQNIDRLFLFCQWRKLLYWSWLQSEKRMPAYRTNLRKHAYLFWGTFSGGSESCRLQATKAEDSHRLGWKWHRVSRIYWLSLSEWTNSPLRRENHQCCPCREWRIRFQYQ